MNPTLKLALVLLLSLEIAFTQSVLVNVLIVIAACGVLWHSHLPLKKYLGLLLLPVIPILGTWMSFHTHGAGDVSHTVWLLSTRIVAYVWLGGILTLTMDLADLFGSLEQNGHVPSKFVYGTLGAFNFLPRVKTAVNQIRVSAMMRGQVLHLWSPQLYFKAIVLALRWSDHLAVAMQTHGYQESGQRTHYRRYPLTVRHWLVAALLVAAVQGVLLVSPY